MISITAVAIGFGGMIVLLFLGLHVATALFLTAVIAIQIYFGGSQLRLDTSRYPTDLVPRALDDAPEMSDVIVPHHRGKKSSQRWRQYIGLTFTTPTH